MSKSRRLAVLGLVVVIVATGGLVPWRVLDRHSEAGQLALYGNVDIRQVELAFNDSQRIVELLATEGDSVRQGQLLGVLDTSQPAPAAEQAQAQAQAQELARLQAGSRPEESKQAQAHVEAAKADLARARVACPPELPSEPDWAARPASRTYGPRILRLARSAPGMFGRCPV